MPIVVWRRLDRKRRARTFRPSILCDSLTGDCGRMRVYTGVPKYDIPLGISLVDRVQGAVAYPRLPIDARECPHRCIESVEKQEWRELLEQDSGQTFVQSNQFAPSMMPLGCPIPRTKSAAARTKSPGQSAPLSSSWGPSPKVKQPGTHPLWRSTV